MECTYASTKALERAYADVSGRAFSNMADHRNMIMKCTTQPRYRPEHYRIVIDEGAVVAGILIVELPVRYGDAVLKLGGIGAVSTDPDCRNRGYGRANMTDTVDFMARDGFDLSLLFGIGDYYHRFGYRTAMTESHGRTHVRSLPSAMPTKWRARKLRRSDIPAMAEFYERHIGRYDFSVARTDEDWKWYFRFDRIHDGYLLVAPDGRPAGYVLAAVDGVPRYNVNELAIDETPDAYEAALALIRRQAKESLSAEVCLNVPPEGGFGRYCHYRREISWISHTRYECGPMCRLFDIEALFGKISGTLAKRWQSAPRDVRPCAITVRCPLGQVAIAATDGDLTVMPGQAAGEVVDLPHEAVTELVMRFRQAPHIVADADVDASDKAIGLLAALFPPAPQMFQMIDHM